MSIERAKQLIKKQENIRLEFKEAANALPANLFETICAMLNRDGGDILLGVSDRHEVKGVEEGAVRTLVANIVNLSNNPQKLDPPFILHPLVYMIEKKTIIHLQVPASSQLHKTAGVVYDRSNDGDFKVAAPHLIAAIYNRKRLFYTEGIIYPKLSIKDFNPALFPKVRNLMSSQNPDHPWLALNDVDMLRMAGLWRKDFQTGEEGYTLAAALLFGKDEVIQQILPHYKIDALVRIQHTARYDDREIIQTNLIDAYELLMSFVAKHLPDHFFMEGDQRVSLRTKIFREVAANLIVHREYTNAQPCTFIVYGNRVETANANNPHGQGPIDPGNFTPFPKNPAIAKFFLQLGRVEELGSGVLNVNKFIKAYAGKSVPVFEEGVVFKMAIPVPAMEDDAVNAGATNGNDAVIEGAGGVNDAVGEGAIEGAIEGATNAVKGKLANLLKAIAMQEGNRVPEYKKATGLPDSTIERYLKQLREANLIEFRGDAPQTGGYYLTKKLHDKLHGKKNRI